jgi:hypothetical protein
VRLLREDYKRILNMEVGLLNGTTWEQFSLSAVGRKAV